MVFQMASNQTETYMEIQLSELSLDVDVKLLLILSNLAILDEAYTKGPKPVLRKKTKKIKP